MTVKDIYALIDSAAPFAAQTEWDNSGLLVGSFSQEVQSVLFALDVTGPVIDEAVALGANLIVTHHPLMFSPRQRLTDEDYEGRLLLRLIGSDISLIAAHTCLDQAPDAMNDVLAALCGLCDVSGEGFLRTGCLPEPLSARAYADLLSDSLGTTVRLMGPDQAIIHRVGLCSGGGSNEWVEAARLSCQAFISGEIKHHHALAMADAGIVAMECGHYATEVPGLFALADALQSALNTVEYKIRIFKSSAGAYAFPAAAAGGISLSEGGPDGTV